MRAHGSIWAGAGGARADEAIAAAMANRPDVVLRYIEMPGGVGVIQL